MPDPFPAPVEGAPAPAARHPRLGHGTSTMLAGTAASAVGAYLFQVIAGRVLGAEDFAPVAAVWTLFFLGVTIFFLPVEQLIIRRLTLGAGRAGAVRAAWPAIAATVAAGTGLAVIFVLATRDRFFAGDARFGLAVAVLFLAHALMIAGRGFLAGRRRFHAYGWVVGADGVAKVLLALVAAAVSPSPLAFAWALGLAPLVVLAFRPFAERPGEPGDDAAPADTGVGFLGAYLVATAASQTVLAAGPIVVGALGGISAQVSVFFVTYTLFRGPMTASYNLVARVLPVFTDLVRRGRHERLTFWATRLGLLGVLGAGAGFVAGILVGPAVVRILFGSEFQPSGVVAGLAAAGVMAGIVGLFITQILVARGATGALAAAWVGALAAAALAIAVADADPVLRTGIGFLVGEGTALIALAGAAMVTHEPDVAHS